MHVLHVIAVEADDAEDARVEAESAIEPYGDGQVWDWYEVGGRWDGVFDGSNMLNYAKNPEGFRAALKRVRDNQNSEFCEALDTVLGRTVEAGDVDDHVFGIPIDDKEEVAKRRTESNREWGDLWKRLANQKVLPIYDPEFRAGPDNVQNLAGPAHMGMLGHYLIKLGNLVGGNYTFNSYYYDASWGGTETARALERCETAPERQWLVAIDLHN